MPELSYQWRCPGCQASRGVNAAEMLAMLRQAGKLRRAADPDPAEIATLFAATAPQFSCPDCGHFGLFAGVATPTAKQSDDDWPEAKLCAGCHRPIPAERLEAVPKAELCAPCQARQERGETDDTPDYCPRCGSVRTLRAVRAGIVRYAFYCPSCRK